MKVTGRQGPTLDWLVRALGEIQGPSFVWGCGSIRGVEQLQRLKDGGVSVPPFTSKWEEATKWREEGIQVWGRRHLHTQGRDIIPLISPSLIKRSLRLSEYWTQFIPSESEWRIHVFGGKTIGRGMKVLEDPTHTHQAMIRSRRLGWVLSHAEDPPKGVRAAAKAAVGVLGYPYGAVDVLWNGKAPYVLEVNGAPALRDDYTRGVWLKAILGRSK